MSLEGRRPGAITVFWRQKGCRLAYSVQIEAQAEMGGCCRWINYPSISPARLADEHDAAQERGEVAKGSVRTDIVPKQNDVRPATAADIGLSRKEIHEARMIHEAEKAARGLIQRKVQAVNSKAMPSRRKAKSLQPQHAPPTVVARSLHDHWIETAVDTPSNTVRAHRRHCWTEAFHGSQHSGRHSTQLPPLHD